MRRPNSLIVLTAAASVLAIGVAALIILSPTFDAPMARAQHLSTTVTSSSGEALRTFLSRDDSYRMRAKLDRVDPLFRAMLIGIEDKRFQTHIGVDPIALGRAIGQRLLRGRIVSGASTLTMQAVRLLEPRPRTIPSKLLEMARAIKLERQFPKDKILELYLTLAPYGGNIEGTRAASLLYFGKEPKTLTPAEAALLVAIPQAPERLSPDRHPAAAKRARDAILARVSDLGVISPEVAEEAMRDPITARRRAMPFHAPHLSERLASQQDGGEIRTTLDYDLQIRIEQLSKRMLEPLGNSVGLAIVVADVQTGAIRAHIGAPDYFDRSRRGAIDMTRAIRSPGSALKPFLYGIAFDEKLVEPRTIVTDVQKSISGYAPANFAKSYHGEVTVTKALQLSLNVPAVQILEHVGPTLFVERLRTAGAGLSLPGKSRNPGLAVVLGGVGISLEDLTSLYSAIGSDGTVKKLHAVETADEIEKLPLISKQAAYDLFSILDTAPQRVPGGQHTARQVSWKTGTSYGFRDAWSIGTDGRYVVGVWVGRADGTPNPGRSGRNTATPIMFEAFTNLPKLREMVDRTPNGVHPLSSRRLLKQFSHFPRVFNGHTNPNLDLRVLYPRDGTEILWQPNVTMTLKARGGKRPLTWIIDGNPIKSLRHRRETDWQPIGPGFVTVTVLDVNGLVSNAKIRLRQAN
jgi:penicillin-binding protein 1C